MEYAWAAKEGIKVGVTTNPWEAVFSASPVVQLTLLLLVSLSVVCWAVIFAKRKQFQNSRIANEVFLETFWSSPSLDSIYEKIGNYSDSSVAKIFKAGFLELQRLAESARTPGTLPGQKSDQPAKLIGHDNLTRALRKATDKELLNIESRLNLLASTSSLSPFIGLFGTVWGIMNAFEKIGQTGSANLAVVAPGISEALITTAIGLLTALPAGAAYNWFIGMVRVEEIELTNFSADFLNIVKRNFFKED